MTDYRVVFLMRRQGAIGAFYDSPTVIVSVPGTSLAPTTDATRAAGDILRAAGWETLQPQSCQPLAEPKAE